MSRVADFYRGSARATARSSASRGSRRAATDDPSHLVDLGDHYFQDGNYALAIADLEAHPHVVQPRAKALAALGDVYLEHDMTPRRSPLCRRPSQLDKDNAASRRQLAVALERARSYQEATTLWTELAGEGEATGDKLLAREARSQIVTLWGLQHRSRRQLPGFTAEFGGNPPDVEAGRTLAEALLHLRRLADAEADAPPGRRARAGRHRDLPRARAVLVQEDKLDDAIAVLRSSSRSSRSARESSTSAWPSTRSRLQGRRTPSRTPRARSS